MKELPKFLNEHLKNQYGEKVLENIVANYQKNRPVTLRVNTLKSSSAEIEMILRMNNIDFTIPTWYPDAFIIQNVKEKEIRSLDIYKEGKIYLQSLSSMLPALFIDYTKSSSILDMAAAPGGKTTQIAALSNNQINITACEKNQIRYDRLKYNVEKQGAKRITILKEDARNLDEYFSFDTILLDAPCSGSGTIHLPDEHLERYCNEKLLEQVVKTQSALLIKALQLLKQGHEMIYSTCSILKEENEEQLQKLLDDNLIEIVPIENTIFENIPTLPSILKGTICVSPSELYEGFFIAKIRKK